MIESFAHKELKNFFERGDRSGINPRFANKLRLQLSLLDAVSKPEQMNVPGYDLHQLKGDLAGH